MENYQIRYCKLDERDKLKKFIDEYWKKDHILSKNNELLDFQHLNIEDERYNFVVAFNVLTQEFDIVLGFIPHSQYSHDTSNKDIWLAIWKKNDKEHPRGLGKKLLDFLEEDFKPTSIGSIGINDDIEQLYLKRGWKSGVLNVWYFLKPSNLITFEKLEVESENYFENKFSKSKEYYKNRYELHPFYTYNKFQGIIYRKIETEKGNCLRIVDFEDKFFIDEFGLNELLIKENSDYIDCLNYGFPNELFESMGFHKRSDTMLIPQWFEPLDAGVKNIKFAFKCEHEYLIVKGDSDQDRPSIIH